MQPKCTPREIRKPLPQVPKLLLGPYALHDLGRYSHRTDQAGLDGLRGSDDPPVSEWVFGVVRGAQCRECDRGVEAETGA